MKIIDITLNDLTRSLRGYFFIGMMIAAPLLISALFFFAFGGAASQDPDLPAVKVGIVNADAIPAESPLEASIGQTIQDMFYDESVQSWITSAGYPDEASARSAVDKQEIGVAVIIPENFSERFLAGKEDAQVHIVEDPTLTIGPLVVENMVKSLLDGVAGGGIAVQTVVERQQVHGVASDPAQILSLVDKYQDWYIGFQRNLFHDPAKAALVVADPTMPGEADNPVRKMIGLVLAGLMIFFAYQTGAYSMTSILREEEEGTLARLFTTPTNRTAILAGKFLAVFLSVIVQGAVLILAARLIFGVNWGEPASVVMAMIAQVFSAAGLGVLLVAFIKTSKQTGPVMGGGLTMLGMLGGLFTVAVPNMPAAFNLLSNFTPQGWVLKTWRITMEGQPAANLLAPFSLAMLIGIAMFAIGAIQFRKRFA